MSAYSDVPGLPPGIEASVHSLDPIGQPVRIWFPTKSPFCPFFAVQILIPVELLEKIVNEARGFERTWKEAEANL
ncbi:MAG: hypothetical protein A3E78_09235 [Alphaproteobacteria bacterium RIFCSPHIGHO2_12_FULL_63_12]|nr:MAG: hypothetical protein A3E78_09235 [Alphaproteobacteria bacterium RIFCSPHIGHO2_12_FULL_63_12]